MNKAMQKVVNLPTLEKAGPKRAAKKLNKRDTKAAEKEKEEKEEEEVQAKVQIKQDENQSEVPLTINFNKFLFIEKRQFLLDFARVKLSKINKSDLESVYSDSLEYKVLKTMVEVNEGNQWSDPNLVSSSKFTLAQIFSACSS